MDRFRKCFWTGLAVRLGCAPWLLQWFHPDERQLLEFAHFQAHGRLQPFLESQLHLRNQTAPWLFSWVIRAWDSLGWSTPHAYLAGFHALIGTWTWLGFWALIRWFRDVHGPAGDRVALRLAWFFALFWAFPMLYSRGLLEAVSFAPACFLLLAIERSRPWHAGFWAGLTSVLRYPSALWAAGGAALALVRFGRKAGSVPQREVTRVMMGALLGFGFAIVLGGLADQAVYGGRLLSSARAYWDFNRPHGPVEQYFGNDSLAVYWHWFEYILTPWLAPLFLIAGIYALWMTPELFLFCAPYIVGHLWTPHREPRFMLPLTPFLALAIATAFQRGHFARAWTWLTRPRAWPVVRALITLHVALNFVWYPLYAWAQWKSGQGELIRHYGAMGSQPTRFVLESDPVAVLGIDALIPRQVAWADDHCHWHRPTDAQPSSPVRLWVLSREMPADCQAVADTGPALPQALARVLRVKTAELYQCPGDRYFAQHCPQGVAPAPAGEPWIGKDLHAQAPR